jgi:hypothetical protein
MQSKDVVARTTGIEDTDTLVTDREMDLILRSLPAATSDEAKQQLAVRLRYWLQHVHPEVVWNAWRPTPKQCRQAKAAAEILHRASRVLSEFDPAMREMIGSGPWTRPVCADDLRPGSAAFRDDARHRFDRTMQTIRDVCHDAQAVASAKYCVGRPPNVVARATIVTLAELFEQATGMLASRRVTRDPDDGQYDTGPFYEFAAAVWPVAFGQGDTGLSTAIRYWSRSGRSNAVEDSQEKSPVPKRSWTQASVPPVVERMPVGNETDHRHSNHSQYWRFLYAYRYRA